MAEKKIVSCTWGEPESCFGCINQNKLHCRWKFDDLLIFNVLTLPVMFGALAGTVAIGLAQHAWWPMIAYILSFPLMLGVAETRVLCSHCPFYAQDGKVLHCLANHGLLKIWHYHPEPMSRLEKRIFIGIFVAFVLMPMGILGYNIVFFSLHYAQYGIITLIFAVCLFVLTALSFASLGTVLLKRICAVCINFSCPLNRVEKENVDAYLRKNPAMKQAWKEKGYRIDFEEGDKKP